MSWPLGVSLRVNVLSLSGPMLELYPGISYLLLPAHTGGTNLPCHSQPTFPSSHRTIQRTLRVDLLRNEWGKSGCFPGWGADTVLWSLWFETLGFSWKSRCSKRTLNLNIYIKGVWQTPIPFLLRWAIQHSSPNPNILPLWGWAGMALSGHAGPAGSQWGATALRVSIIFFLELFAFCF